MAENNVNTPAVPEENPSELRAVRVGKLTALQAAGADPFTKTKYEVTCVSGVRPVIFSSGASVISGAMLFSSIVFPFKKEGQALNISRISISS